jgi:hypothetical protein
LKIIFRKNEENGNLFLKNISLDQFMKNFHEGYKKNREMENLFERKFEKKTWEFPSKSEEIENIFERRVKNSK